MTINIFVLKGDLNGKIVVVRFFFVGYTIRALAYLTNERMKFKLYFGTMYSIH